jgi:hypothetical protein
VSPAPRNPKRFNWLSLSPSTLPQLFIFSWLWSIPIIGVLLAGVNLIYASQVPSGVRWSVFGTASVIGSAAYFTGGIIGFLFGVPRTVQGSGPSTGRMVNAGRSRRCTGRMRWPAIAWRRLRCCTLVLHTSTLTLKGQPAVDLLT